MTNMSDVLGLTLSPEQEAKVRAAMEDENSPLFQVLENMGLVQQEEPMLYFPELEGKSSPIDEKFITEISVKKALEMIDALDIKIFDALSYALFTSLDSEMNEALNRVLKNPRFGRTACQQLHEQQIHSLAGHKNPTGAVADVIFRDLKMRYLWSNNAISYSRGGVVPGFVETRLAYSFSRREVASPEAIILIDQLSQSTYAYWSKVLREDAFHPRATEIEIFLQDLEALKEVVKKRGVMPNKKP